MYDVFMNLNANNKNMDLNAINKNMNFNANNKNISLKIKVAWLATFFTCNFSRYRTIH
jgi:hypothetical protein